MNKIILIGNVTNEPEERITNTGVNVCSFGLAVNQRIAGRGAEQETEFFRINAWRGLGEICGKYVKKGNKVAVVGHLRGRAYTTNKGEARYSLEVTVEEVEFLTPKGTKKEADEYGFMDITDEPLPF